MSSEEESGGGMLAYAAKRSGLYGLNITTVMCIFPFSILIACCFMTCHSISSTFVLLTDPAETDEEDVSGDTGSSWAACILTSMACCCTVLLIVIGSVAWWLTLPIMVPAFMVPQHLISTFIYGTFWCPALCLCLSVCIAFLLGFATTDIAKGTSAGIANSVIGSLDLFCICCTCTYMLLFATLSLAWYHMSGGPMKDLQIAGTTAAVIIPAVLTGGASVAAEGAVVGGAEALLAGGTEALLAGGTEALVAGGTEALVAGGAEAVTTGVLESVGTEAAAAAAPKFVSPLTNLFSKSGMQDFGAGQLGKAADTSREMGSRVFTKEGSSEWLAKQVQSGAQEGLQQAIPDMFRPPPPPAPTASTLQQPPQRFQRPPATPVNIFSKQGLGQLAGNVVQEGMYSAAETMMAPNQQQPPQQQYQRPPATPVNIFSKQGLGQLAGNVVQEGMYSAAETMMTPRPTATT